MIINRNLLINFVQFNFFSHQYPLSDECMLLVSESLRILFNITLELQNQTCNEVKNDRYKLF